MNKPLALLFNKPTVNRRAVMVYLSLAVSLLFTSMSAAKDIPGSSPTSWGVGPSGAFQFQMPVTIPAGRNGVQPNLSINFSSMRGNGSLGVGWGVSGLGAITRCGQTFATNGQKRGVQHNSEDRFCLNGQQLVVVKGSYGAAGSEYRTEVDQFAKIKAIGNGSININDNGRAPTSWEVWRKDGSIRYYGSGVNGQFKLPGTNSVHAWKLSQVSDRDGNSYTAEYRASDGAPTRIDYTHHSGLSAKQAVVYYYEPRPDVRTQRVLGSSISQTLRLNRIVVRSNNYTVREYNFAYEYQQSPPPAGQVAKASRLESITECGQNGRCMPSIPIEWKSENSGFGDTNESKHIAPTFLTESVNIAGDDVEIQYGTWADVNGDGLMDMVIAITKPNGSEVLTTYLKTLDTQSHPTGWVVSPAWSLPKTLKSYNDDYLGITQFTQSQISQGQLVDVNGDGLVDLVYAYTHFTDASQIDHSSRVSKKEVYLNSETGFSTTPSTAYAPKDFIFDYVSNGSGVSVMQTVRSRLIDLNGDGLPDWVTAYHNYRASTAANKFVMRTYLNTGNGWSPTANAAYAMRDVFVEYIGTHPPMPHGQFSDINGDGLVDWVQGYQAHANNTPTRATWINTGSGWREERNVAGQAANPYVLPEAIYRKVNGAAGPMTRGTLIDINGDGLPDWVKSFEENSDHSQTGTYLNTGKGWAYHAGYKPPFIYVDHKYANAYRGWPVSTRGTYVDMNRDGLVDYVEAYKDKDHLEHKNTWLNTGAGWTPANALNTDWLLYDYSGRNQNRDKIRVSAVFDIDSDGSPDWVKLRKNELDTKLNLWSRPNQLAQVTTNAGVEVIPAFDSLSGMNDLYTRVPISSITNAPITKEQNGSFFSSSFYVTKELKVSAPNGDGYNTSTYKYGGGQASRDGRGFLGFYEFITIDEKGITTRSEHYQAWPFTGRARKSVVSIGSTPLSSTENSYLSRNISHVGTTTKSKFVYMDSSTSEAFELNGGEKTKTVISRRTYDDYGNVTVNVSEVRAPDQSLINRVTTTQSYETSASYINAWLPGLVSFQTTQFHAPGKPAITANQTDYAYYSNGRLRQSIREPNSTEFGVRLITDYVYDAYGNVTSETTRQSSSDPEPRGQTITFNAQKRLPATMTNSLGHVSRITYDAKCDLPQTATDVNNLVIRYTYDEFCRELTKAPPVGGTTTTSYQQGDSVYGCTTCGANTPKFSVRQEQPGKAPVTGYMNAYMLEIESATEGMLLETTLQQTEYDRYGRVSSRTQPYFYGEPVVWQPVSYDVLDRPVRVDLPFDTYADQAAYTSESYSVDSRGYQKVTTRDAEGRYSHSYKNALGQIIEIENVEGKKLTYLFDAQGNLDQTRDSANNVIDVTYDVLGRRTALLDPDLGLTLYKNNAYGEVIEQTDAKNQTRFTKYDQLGRMVERRVLSTGSTSVFDVSTWEYDQAANGIGLPSSMSTLNQVGTQHQAVTYSKSYAYDTYGRPAADSTRIKDEDFTNTYAYDAQSRLSVRHFPESGSGMQMSVNFNYQNGYLSSITDKPLTAANCIEHWRADRYDALGRLREETLGKIISTQRGMDRSQGVLRHIEATLLVGNSTKIQDLVYDYDAVNNVRLRHDAIDNVTEEFGYDQLDRLTMHNRGGELVTEVQYDDIGNISYKSDVGKYEYNGQGGPHALARVKLPLGPGTDLSVFQVKWEWNGEQLDKALPTIHGQEFQYDANGNIEQSGNRSVYWTAFDKPYMMYSMKTGGGYHGSSIEYDANFNRMAKQEANYDGLGLNPQVVESTIYVGKEYQKITDNSGAIKHRYTINAGSSVVQIERSEGSDKDIAKYFLTDNLGSTDIVVDSLGRVQQKMLFDPWGMRQQMDSSLVDSGISVNAVTDRGYTGHEMDDEAGLINMNARIYDPYLGRFLSADPVLPDAMDMQQYNRYSYVTNNPLRYTDSTGNYADGGLASIVIASILQTLSDVIFGGQSGRPQCNCVNTHLPSGSAGFSVGGLGRLITNGLSYEGLTLAEIYALLLALGYDPGGSSPNSGEQSCDPSENSDCEVVAPSPGSGSSPGEGSGISIGVTIPIGDDNSDVNFAIGLSVGAAENGRCKTKICFSGLPSEIPTELTKWKAVYYRYAQTPLGAKLIADYFNRGGKVFNINLLYAFENGNDYASYVQSEGTMHIVVDGADSSYPNSLVFEGENGTLVGSKIRTFAHEAFHALNGRATNDLQEEYDAVAHANAVVAIDAVFLGDPDGAGVRVGYGEGRSRVGAEEAGKVIKR